MSEVAKKHLRVSPLIFKYVLREFMIPLACALAAFAFLFLVNNVFDDLPDFMSKDVPMRVVLAYFLSLQPHNLLNVIPISVLLAASFMTVMMGRNNELSAMRRFALANSGGQEGFRMRRAFAANGWTARKRRRKRSLFATSRKIATGSAVIWICPM